MHAPIPITYASLIFCVFFSFPYFLSCSTFLCSFRRPLYCSQLPLLILSAMVGFAIFTPQLLLDPYGCPSKTTHQLVGCSTTTIARMCWLHHFPFLDKIACLVSYLPLFFTPIIWIRIKLFYHLPLWHASSGLSLYFFWVRCHPNKTFLPNKFEREPQNRLPLSPHCQTMPFEYLDSWPTFYVLAGYKQVVPWPFVHAPFHLNLFHSSLHTISAASVFV